MNEIERDHFRVLDDTHGVRNEGLGALTDEHLALALPGDNPTLGALIGELYTMELAYSASFSTFRTDFSSIGKIAFDDAKDMTGRFETADAEIKSTIAALSDTQIYELVDRGGWSVPAIVNFHIYREGVVIYLGKIDVYLRAFGITRGDKWKGWFG